MTKQEELARNVENETDDIRVICTTVHKAKGLEYGCVIMPYMGMDIASMKKADLDVYVENDNWHMESESVMNQIKNIIPIMIYRRNKLSE